MRNDACCCCCVGTNACICLLLRDAYDFMFYSRTNISQATRRHLAHAVHFKETDFKFRLSIAMNENLVTRSILLLVITISGCRHVASAEGSFSTCEWLLDNGASVNALDRFQRTPLEVWCSHGAASRKLSSEVTRHHKPTSRMSHLSCWRHDACYPRRTHMFEHEICI